MHLVNFQVEHLGHTVSKDRVSADPIELDSIAKWPVPTFVKALRGFLGSTCYY